MTIDMLRQKRRKKQVEKWTQWAILVEAFFIALFPSLATIALMIGILLTVWKFRLDKERVFRHLPFDVPLALFVFLGALSITVSPDKAFSFYNYYHLVGVYALTYLLIGQNVSQPEQVKKILLALAGSALLVILYGFCQYIFGIDTSDMKWVDGEAFPELTKRVFSTWENPNILAGYLDAVLCLLLGFFMKSCNKLQRIVLVLGMVLAAACLAMTYARGACLAIAIVFFCYGLVKDWRILLACMACAVLAFWADPALYERIASVFTKVDTSSEMRLAFWEATVAMIQDHPFLGIGWGAYWMIYPEYDFYMQGAPIRIVHAHNIYLNYMAEIGIAGAIAFFWFFFGTMYSCLRAEILPAEKPLEPVRNEEGTTSFLSLIQGGKSEEASPSEEEKGQETSEHGSEEAEAADSPDKGMEETEPEAQTAEKKEEEEEKKEEKSDETTEDTEGASVRRPDSNGEESLNEEGLNEAVSDKAASEKEPVSKDETGEEGTAEETATEEKNQAEEKASEDEETGKDAVDAVKAGNSGAGKSKVVSISSARSKAPVETAASNTERDGRVDEENLAAEVKSEDTGDSEEKEETEEKEEKEEKEDIKSLIKELTQEAEERGDREEEEDEEEEDEEEDAQQSKPLDDYWAELCQWDSLRLRAGLSLGIGLAFISVALNGLTDDLLFNIPTSMLLWFLAALGAVNAAMDPEEKKPS